MLTTLFLKCCMKYNVQIYITLIFNLRLFQIPSPACFHGLFYREKDCKENGGTRKFGQRGKSKITFLDAFINQFKKPMLIEEEICQLILMLNHCLWLYILQNYCMCLKKPPSELMLICMYINDTKIGKKFLHTKYPQFIHMVLVLVSRHIT